MKILSIHAQTHDTSVVGINNNTVTYIANNERFSRIKMDRGIPLKALQNFLEFTKTKPEEIDEVVFIGSRIPFGYFKHLKENISWLRDTKGKYLLLFLKRPHRLLLEFLLLTAIPRYLLREVIPQIIIKRKLRGFKGKYSYVHHHMAHHYSAYFGSGWSECLVVCIEGSGFNETMSIYKVKENNWEKVTESHLPHSAGVFYGVVTTILGFKAYKHAGKVTGLAAYGNPRVLAKVVNKLMWTDGLKIKVDSFTLMKWFVNYPIEKVLPEEMRGAKREDVAAAFQKRLEDCILEIVQKALKQTGMRKITLAGGVAANVKLNQKIHQLKEVDEIFIQPGMGDEGLALGGCTL